MRVKSEKEKERNIKRTQAKETNLLPVSSQAVRLREQSVYKISLPLSHKLRESCERDIIGIIITTLSISQPFSPTGNNGTIFHVTHHN
jgi:hypothetical protein